MNYAPLQPTLVSLPEALTMFQQIWFWVFAVVFVMLLVMTATRTVMTELTVRCLVAEGHNIEADEIHRNGFSKVLNSLIALFVITATVLTSAGQPRVAALIAGLKRRSRRQLSANFEGSG